LKENFDLTKEELCVYHIDLKLRESIVEFYTLLEKFTPTEKDDFDEKINKELHAVIAGTSKLTYGDCTHHAKNYKELEKNLFDYIETKEACLKNDFCEKFSKNYYYYKILILLYKLKEKKN
jgi:hypothetical protein